MISDAQVRALKIAQTEEDISVVSAQERTIQALWERDFLRFWKPEMAFGRVRGLYKITKAGRAALREWEQKHENE